MGELAPHGIGNTGPRRRRTWAVPVLAIALVPSAASAQSTVGPVSAEVVVADAGSVGGTRASEPAAAENVDTGGYLVVWIAHDVDDLDDAVYGQAVSVSGDPVGQAFRISEAGRARHPAVAASPTDSMFLVVYVWSVSGSDATEIRARRVRADGSMLGDAMAISNPGDRSGHPDVAFHPDREEFLVVWEANSAPFVVDLDIHGVRIGPSEGGFGPIGEVIRVSRMSDPATNRTATQPAVSVDPASGGYRVVWQSDGGGLPHLTTEIFGRRLDAAGQPVGDPVARLSTMSAFLTERDAVEADVACGDECVVAWAGDGADLPDEQFEVFAAEWPAVPSGIPEAKRLSDAGPLGATARSPAIARVADRTFAAWRRTYAPGLFQMAATSVDGSGDPGERYDLSAVGGSLGPTVSLRPDSTEAVVLWSDGRVIGRRYRLAGAVSVERDPSLPGVWLRSMYPNPFRSSLTIEYAIERPSHVRIDLYDTLGRIVALAVDGLLGRGDHRAVVDAGDLPAGPYMVRMVTDGRPTRSATVVHIR